MHVQFTVTEFDAIGKLVIYMSRVDCASLQASFPAPRLINLAASHNRSTLYTSRVRSLNTLLLESILLIL